MTRDDLEAVIWRSAPRLSPAAVDAILRAADDYATAQCVTAICAPGLAAAQARRRAALDAALAAIELRGRYERKAA